jgi:hypothetical protein
MIATQFVHSRDACRDTGIGSTRTLKATCARYGIPVHRLNARVLVLKREDYQLLLDRVTGK